MMRILFVCNYKPGRGGISGQVELLQKHLVEEGEIVDIFSTRGSVLDRILKVLRLHSLAKSYDILHVHCCSGRGFLPAIVSIIATFGLKIRIVLTYHGGGAEVFFTKHPKITRYILNKTDHNIVLSDYIGQVFSQNKIPYSVIPNIIESQQRLYRERTSISPNYVCTRSHEELYNIPCILRAFMTIKQRIPNAKLTLVGDGTIHDTLIKYVRENQIQDIIFVGRIENNDIYEYLDQSDILLSASRVDNMPVSILEAMNAGLLVISSKVGGIPFMIEDKITGLLFEDNNDHDLVEKMEWADNHPKECLAITRQAKDSLSIYSWERIGVKIREIYGQN